MKLPDIIKTFLSTTKGQIVIFIPLLLVITFFTIKNKKVKVKNEEHVHHVPKAQGDIPRSIEEAKHDLKRRNDSNNIVSMSKWYSETFKNVHNTKENDIPQDSTESLDFDVKEEESNTTSKEVANMIWQRKNGIANDNSAMVNASLEKLSMILESMNSRMDKMEEIINTRYSTDDRTPNTSTSSTKENKGIHIVTKHKVNVTNEENETAINKQFLKAVIDKDLIIEQGDMIPIRLKEAFFNNKVRIPSNTVFYAKASFDESRIRVTTNGIVVKDNVLPLKLDIYDYDGFPGIYSPGTKESDIARKETAEAIKSMDTNQGYTVTEAKKFADQLASNAANAAFGITKVLAARKISDQKIKINAGYPLLIKIKDN